jgi:putative transposase
MAAFRQIFYQIVFSTKFREATINETYETELYKYIWGIINTHKCKMYRINSLPDHIHIFTDLHPSISLSDFVKSIKVASSIWMKASGKFPKFTFWQEGYGAFTYSIREKDMIINYIKNQKNTIKLNLLKMSTKKY